MRRNAGSILGSSFYSFGSLHLKRGDFGTDITQNCKKWFHFEVDLLKIGRIFAKFHYTFFLLRRRSRQQNTTGSNTTGSSNWPFWDHAENDNFRTAKCHENNPVKLKSAIGTFGRRFYTHRLGRSKQRHCGSRARACGPSTTVVAINQFGVCAVLALPCDGLLLGSRIGFFSKGSLE